jgi:hypothetical protein
MNKRGLERRRKSIVEGLENVLHQKFNIQDCKILITTDVTEKNIHEIAGTVNFGGLTDSEVRKMYHELDTNKDGKVSIEEFVNGVIEVSASERSSSFKSFFDKVNMSITSKSSQILDKLKLLKEAASLKDDKAAVDNIDW